MTPREQNEKVICTQQVNGSCLVFTSDGRVFTPHFKPPVPQQDGTQAVEFAGWAELPPLPLRLYGPQQ